MFVETTLMKGRGTLTLTGHLGDVMKESARAALSYARSHAKELKINEKLFQSQDIHVHVPAGAIPKDGPSAGVTMATSLISALIQKPISKSVAMTGEITLRGRVLAIGGVREKVLAAKRAKITKVLIPEQNMKDLYEIPDHYLEGIDIVPVSNIGQVLDHAIFGAQVEKKAKVGKGSNQKGPKKKSATKAKVSSKSKKAPSRSATTKSKTRKRSTRPQATL